MSIQRTISRLLQQPARVLSAFALAALLVLAGCDVLSWPPGNDEVPRDDGIVHSVVQAPVAPDGNVAERTTDLVLNLDVSMDPNDPGLILHEGDQIRVTLPEDFEKDRDLPLLTIFDCLDQNLACDTAVLLLGWPQGALGAPPPLGYEVRYEGEHTIVITATEDLIPNPPSNPGLKQIHLLLNSFTNPPPGHYEIGIEVETGGLVKHGIGRVHILPKARPSIHVTTVFSDFLNTIYQETAPGELTPLPFDVLLWNRAGTPFEGVTIAGNHLVRGHRVVGRISIETPPGATGQEVFAEELSSIIAAPVTGIPVGHLRTFFRAGSATGNYVVNFTLNGGNAVQMFVRVN